MMLVCIINSTKNCFVHNSVVHKYHFVDPETRVHTQAVENFNLVINLKMELFYDDSMKIGVGLIAIGLIFYSLGICFFLDRGFLCIGNLSFLMGLVTLVGPKNTGGFFLRRGKIVGSAVFFGGFLLILIGWFLFTTIGFCLQIYGLFLLFRDFVRVIFRTRTIKIKMIF